MFARIMAQQLGTQVTVPAPGGSGLRLQTQTITHPPVLESPPASPDSEPESPRVHTYRPLDDDEIRLLVLNPGAPGEPIRCFLEHYPVATAKPYHALSYVWGDPSDPQIILLDGCPVPVSRNLAAFLTAYRSEQYCPVLWVDAVCINQADLEERKAQIQLMKRVYEGADRIVIWLGESTPETSAAVDRMDKIYVDWWLPRLENAGGSEHRALQSMTDSDAAELLADFHCVEEEEGRILGSGSVSISQKEWDGMHDIFTRPWWSRIWVYQEATAPSRNGAEVHIGSYTIHFNRLLAINNILRGLSVRSNSQYSAPTGTTPAYMQIYRELRDRYQKTGSSQFLRLADLLPSLRGFDATNPRDKLYALIPTSLDGAELLEVAYERSVEDVYTKSAWTFIQKHKNLDILGHCSAGDCASPLGLPSWVPDWTAKSTATHFFKRGTHSSEGFAGDYLEIEDKGQISRLYSVSGDSVAQAEVDESGKKLSCQGFIFDIVENVSPSAGQTHSSSDVHEQWALWLYELYFSRAKRQPYILKPALAHTLVADCNRVAVDVGVRDFKADEPSPAPARGEWRPEAVDTKNGVGVGGDITGPHPATFRRKLFITKEGYIGLVAEQVRAGDLVVVLMGGQLPFVLRRMGEHYTLVGEAYVHAVMDGEAITKRELEGKQELSTFEIW